MPSNSQYRRTRRVRCHGDYEDARGAIESEVRSGAGHRSVTDREETARGGNTGYGRGAAVISEGGGRECYYCAIGVCRLAGNDVRAALAGFDGELKIINGGVGLDQNVERMLGSKHGEEIGGAAVAIGQG